jgi:hypothetical protein
MRKAARRTGGFLTSAPNQFNRIFLERMIGCQNDHLLHQRLATATQRATGCACAGHGPLEPNLAVRAVAEGLVGGSFTTAERDFLARLNLVARSIQGLWARPSRLDPT